MKPKNTTSTQTSPAQAAGVFAAATEAALADLEQRLPTGMGPLEHALAARIRHAASALWACAEQLATDELMVLGSTGQRRPHPLLKTEQELRREIGDSLEKLTFRAEQGVMFVRLQALTRLPTEADEEAGEAS